MRKMIITVAAVLVNAAAWADDFPVNTPVLDAAHLPKRSVVSYEGTWATTGAWAGVSGPVQLVVDFGTGGNIAAQVGDAWMQNVRVGRYRSSPSQASTASPAVGVPR
jgi:hypothetical protein